MALMELENITKTYSEGGATTTILRGIDLSIEEQEFVAIVGPSGAGKSSCLEILGTLSLPTTGTYRLDGENVGEQSDDELSRRRASMLGFVFQSFNLLGAQNAVDNVAMPLLYQGVPRSERRERARELLAKVGVEKLADRVPAKMSGGERQRVAIARALSNDPAVILADEPTGNLDQQTGREILDVLRELNAQGRTLVVVTHNDEVASAADRIIRIRDGQIEFDSSVSR